MKDRKLRSDFIKSCYFSDFVDLNLLYKSHFDEQKKLIYLTIMQKVLKGELSYE